ncbi:MAG: dTDP-4-dehydrorhamnose reductase [Cyanobacteria bacterium P01_D01_bin.44]
MKILLIGSQGQVGQALQMPLSQLGEVVSWHRQDLDLTHLEVLSSAVLTQQPDVIVNAAAYTAVDKAEAEPTLAHQINGAAPKQLALAARDCGATLIHISTDYVFDGTQGSPYAETDIPHPQSVYGHSKLAGEQGIQAVGGRYAILRTAWVYGAQGKGNFVKTMLRLGADRETLKVVADQVGSPTWSQEIANTIAAMIPVLNEQTYGLYHYTNSGVASWYDLAVAVFEEAAQLGFPLKVQNVLPIATAEYPLPAQRPTYSVLSGIKLRDLLGITAPHWRQSLRQMLTELAKQTL